MCRKNFCSRFSPFQLMRRICVGKVCFLYLRLSPLIECRQVYRTFFKCISPNPYIRFRADFYMTKKTVMIIGNVRYFAVVAVLGVQSAARGKNGGLRGRAHRTI